MMKFGLFILMFLILSVCVPTQALSQDAVRKATPPIVNIKITGVEPLPSGVSKVMGFGSPAGGAGEAGSDAMNNAPAWINAPLIVHPQVTVAKFAACGYPSSSYPEVMVTSPSGHSEQVSIEDGDGCWAYYQTWSYGMELGEYKIVAKHAKGTLTHSWFVEYPPFTMVGLLSNPNSEEAVQTRFLMGFEPEEQLTLRIYSPEIPVELTSEADSNLPGAWDSDRGGYVATRTINADENGAVIIQFTASPSTPFDVTKLGFTIDGYLNPIGEIGSPAHHDYYVTKPSSPDQPEKLYSLFPPDIEAFLRIPSIWKGLTFKDMKSPGTRTYQTSLSNIDSILLNFTWCADTPARLAEILEPFELTITVNDEPISLWNLTRYEDRACRKWAGGLTPKHSKLQIVFHYTLREDIFDGSGKYKAGEYFHIINATFR